MAVKEGALLVTHAGVDFREGELGNSLRQESSRLVALTDRIEAPIREGPFVYDPRAPSLSYAGHTMIKSDRSDTIVREVYMSGRRDTYILLPERSRVEIPVNANLLGPLEVKGGVESTYEEIVKALKVIRGHPGSLILELADIRNLQLRLRVIEIPDSYRSRF